MKKRSVLLILILLSFPAYFGGEILLTWAKSQSLMHQIRDTVIVEAAQLFPEPWDYIAIVDGTDSALFALKTCAAKYNKEPPPHFTEKDFFKAPRPPEDRTGFVFISNGAIVGYREYYMPLHMPDTEFEYCFDRTTAVFKQTDKDPNIFTLIGRNLPEE